MARGDGFGDVGGPAALAWVGGTGLVLLLLAAAFHLRRRAVLAQAKLERASLDTDVSTLRSGVVTIAGTVETIDDEGPPVIVVVDEKRIELDWKETTRTVEARPFVMRLANGVRVQIDPGPEPVLRDALDEIEQLDTDRRRRRACLVHGERVFVRGYLAAPIGDHVPFRTSDVVVIGAPPRSPMLFSTEALSGALDGVFDFQIVALMGTFIVSQLLYIVFYVNYVRYWLGGLDEPPSIVFDRFLFVLIVAIPVVIGSLAMAWKERPWHR